MSSSSLDRISVSEIPLLASTGFMLHKVGAVLINAAEEVLAAYQMRLRYFYVLAALENAGDFSQQDLSVALGVDPTSMVNVIDEMESRGHAERRRNPHDRRRYMVNLTDAGRTELKRASRALEKLENEFLGVLGANEQESLNAALSKLMVDRSAAVVDCD